jgi:Holliday junction DNA helicase RuvA
VIAALKGLVLEKSANEVIVDVNGVGYRVGVSLLSASRLPETGAPIFLRIRSVIREDAFDLYGFLSRTEEEMFLLLNSVNGVGPKSAMAVLSGLELEDLVGAIAKGDVARLKKIHGVGTKTAERIVLELKDKAKLLGTDGTPTSNTKGKTSKPRSAANDLISALVNLGYKEAQAEQAAQLATERAGEEASFEVLFRDALKQLRG